MDPDSMDTDPMDAAPMDAQRQRRTNGWPPTRKEWVGLIVAIVLGMFAVVVLGWFGALR